MAETAYLSREIEQSRTLLALPLLGRRVLWKAIMQLILTSGITAFGGYKCQVSSNEVLFVTALLVFRYSTRSKFIEGRSIA
jgi:hypothetical protein